MEKRLLNNCHLLSTILLYSVLISLTQIIQVDVIYCRYHVEKLRKRIQCSKVCPWCDELHHLKSAYSVPSYLSNQYICPYLPRPMRARHTFSTCVYHRTLVRLVVCILGQLSYLYLCTRTPAQCCKNRLAINRRMCTHYKKEWDVFLSYHHVYVHHKYIIRTHYITLISL